MIIVTTDKVPGKEIKEVKGLVSGVSVQTKNVISDFWSRIKIICRW